MRPRSHPRCPATRLDPDPPAVDGEFFAREISARFHKTPHPLPDGCPCHVCGARAEWRIRVDFWPSNSSARGFASEMWRSRSTATTPVATLRSTATVRLPRGLERGLAGTHVGGHAGEGLRHGDELFRDFRTKRRGGFPPAYRFRGGAQGAHRLRESACAARASAPPRPGQ